MSTVASERFELLEHTADLGIQVYAGSLDRLFIIAAKAMFKLICPKAKIITRNRHPVQISGEDRQELLVNWLSELNYLFQTRQFLVGHIDTLNLADHSLNAIVSGERFDPQHHLIHTDIKAVTYHKIYLAEQQPGEWIARIYFDV